MKDSAKKSVVLLLYTAICLLLFAAISAAVDRQTEFTIFFDGWWTLFIMVPAVGDMINRGVKTGNLVSLISGAVLFIALQDFSSPDAVWKLALPAIVLTIGIGIIHRERTLQKSGKRQDEVSVIAVFSKTEAAAEENEAVNNVFSLAIFGKSVIDLKNAQLTDKTRINLVSVFGEITVLLPEETDAEAKGLLILAGCRNKKQGEGIKIDYNSVFGEINIQ